MRGGRFVGIDKGDVVAFRFAVFQQFVEGEQGGLEVEADFVRHARFAPRLLRVFGKAGVDVAGGDAAVVGQCKGYGGAAVAGKYADFEVFFRPCQADEPREYGGLFGRDGHFAHAVPGGTLPQTLQDGRFGFADAAQVV